MHMEYISPELYMDFLAYMAAFIWQVVPSAGRRLRPLTLTLLFGWNAGLSGVVPFDLHPVAAEDHVHAFARQIVGERRQVSRDLSRL